MWLLLSTKYVPLVLLLFCEHTRKAWDLCYSLFRVRPGLVNLLPVISIRFLGNMFCSGHSKRATLFTFSCRGDKFGLWTFVQHR